MKVVGLALSLIVAGSMCQAQQPDEVAIQGVWRNTAPREKRYLLVFCGDSLIGLNVLLGAQESTFRIDQGRRTIDIDRAEGLQLGVYALKGDELKLTLADVNEPRPNTREARGYNKTGYVFERQN
jgi:hypothetical protein